MSNIERRRKRADGIGTENQGRTRVIGDKMNRAFRPPSKKEERSLRNKGKEQGGSPENTEDSSKKLGF